MPKTRELWAADETAAFLRACYDLTVHASILVPAGQVWAVGRPREMVQALLPEYGHSVLPVAPYQVDAGGVLSPLL